MRDVNLSFMAIVYLPKLLIFRSFQHGLIEDFFWNTLSVFVMFFVDFFVMFHFLKLH